MMDIAVNVILGILDSIVALKSMNVVINHVETMEIAWSATQPFVCYFQFFHISPYKHISNHSVMHNIIGWTRRLSMYLLR